MQLAMQRASEVNLRQAIAILAIAGISYNGDENCFYFPRGFWKVARHHSDIAARALITLAKDDDMQKHSDRAWFNIADLLVEQIRKTPCTVLLVFWAINRLALEDASSVIRRLTGMVNFEDAK